MMITPRRARLADGLILLSALLWGGEYVVVKEVVEYLPPAWINAFRFIISGLLVLIVFPRRVFGIGRREFLAGLLLGFFLFGGFILQTIGIQYTTASKSGFLTSTYVVMVPFIYWLIRRRYPGIRAFIAAAVCTAGIALLSLESGEWRLNRGDVLTLLAALTFCGSIIGFDWYAKIYDPIRLSFMEMTTGGVLSLILALTVETFPSAVHWGTGEILQIAYIVFLGSFVCHLISNVAMQWAHSSHAAVLWSMESVFALVLGILFLGETPDLRSGIGFLLVFVALLVSESGKREHQ